MDEQQQQEEDEQEQEEQEEEEEEEQDEVRGYTKKPKSICTVHAQHEAAQYRPMAIRTAGVIKYLSCAVPDLSLPV